MSSSRRTNRVKEQADLKVYLDEQATRFNQPGFIDNDPIVVPYQFTLQQDIEIIGFWTAMLSWGQRTTIINKANNLIALMDGAPYDFIMHHKERDLQRFHTFKHRTFNYTDTLYFLHFFTQWYRRHSTLEEAFLCDGYAGQQNVEQMLIYFHQHFFDDADAPKRTRKHVPTPLSGSSCKRLNMFLRWMVRSDNNGVDFGLWKRIRPDQLICPLDVHVDRVARKLKLLNRKQTDWRAAVELTEALKTFDAADPVRYDFALFGIGLEAKSVLRKP